MDKATTSATTAEQATHPPERPSLDVSDKEITTAMPTQPNETVLGDSATKRSYLDAMQRYYEYRANGYAYRNRVFEWQLFASRLIFVVVLVLVGVGIFFAAVQFRGAMRAASRSATITESKTPIETLPLATQLEISAKGIVVNSSVMGIIILALSLGFFYLYLVYVYPITDVF
jgi:hypothetical protein